MHKSQKAATGVLSGDRTQDALHSCAEPTTQLPFQLCSHSLGRFVDWLVRALHLDRYRVRPGCGRGQRPPRSPWWYEAMRPPALSNRLRRPGCVHPPQLGQRLRRKLCHVLRNTRRPRGIVANGSPIDHIPRRTLLLLQKCAGRLPKNLFLNQV